MNSKCTKRLGQGLLTPAMPGRQATMSSEAATKSIFRREPRRPQPSTWANLVPRGWPPSPWLTSGELRPMLGRQEPNKSPSAAGLVSSELSEVGTQRSYRKTRGFRVWIVCISVCGSRVCLCFASSDQFSASLRVFFPGAPKPLVLTKARKRSRCFREGEVHHVTRKVLGEDGWDKRNLLSIWGFIILNFHPVVDRLGFDENFGCGQVLIFPTLVSFAN